MANAIPVHSKKKPAPSPDAAPADAPEQEQGQPFVIEAPVVMAKGRTVLPDGTIREDH